MNQNISMDLLVKSKSIKCKCGSQFFYEVTIVKDIKGIVIGQTVISLVKILKCFECSEVFNEHKKFIDETTN